MWKTSRGYTEGQHGAGRTLLVGGVDGALTDDLRSGFALEQSFTAPLPCRHTLTIPLDRPETPAPVRLCTATGNYRFEHHEGMMNSAEQQFLKALDDKLWKAADKLRANLDAANYKHVVLGLIFLKYVSDAFEERQEELLERFKDENDDIYYLPPEDYDGDEDYQQALLEELEVLDYYREANVFWVPKAARWSTLKEKAVLPVGTVLWQDDAGNDVKLRSVSWLIDNALEEIEKSNAKLKGILNRISQYQLDNDKLLGLINTFSDTSFTRPVFEGEMLSLHSKDILGHVYEYFLGQFALAEGKQGGQYYTPKSIVTLIVEMLQPYSGRVYDPAMGSGGFFVSSDKFIEEHASEQHYDASEQKKHN